MIKWVERGVLLAAILSMLFVWPYGGIREDKKDSSLSEDYGYTEPLQVGEYASQYFVAETDFLKTLEIAVNYNQEEERNGHILSDEKYRPFPEIPYAHDFHHHKMSQSDS